MWAFTYGFMCSGSEEHKHISMIIDYLPSLMIEIALTINVRVWASFYIRIGKMSSNPLRWSGAFTDFVDKYLPEYDKELELKVKQMKNSSAKQQQKVIILFYIFLITILSTFGICLYFDISNYSSISWMLVYKMYGNLNVAIIFLVLGISFAVIGCKIYYRIKLFHPEYFDQHKNKILIATLGLTIPSLMRSIWDFVFFFYDRFSSGDILFKFYIFSYFSGNIRDLITIAFQFNTMVFGLIRVRSKKKLGRSYRSLPNTESLVGTTDYLDTQSKRTGTSFKDNLISFDPMFERSEESSKRYIV